MLTIILRSGTIGLQEFISLCGYLDQWRGLFQQFDVDRSGAIDRVEFSNALSAFGYRLSDKFITILYTSYDKKGESPGYQLDKTLVYILQNVNMRFRRWSNSFRHVRAEYGYCQDFD
jgi:EF-hand domain